ncbi:MAG: hypothetical protein WC364_05755 [Eubacteriales bacterium]|jgi:hypothetical protein
MAEVKTLDQIKTELALAIASGNDADVMRLSRAIMQYAQDIKKSEADKLKQEAEQLAGKREALEVKIHKALANAVAKFTDELLAVKSKGFSIVVDHMENDKGQLDAAGEVKVIGACKLTVPTIKAAKVSTGTGGGTGVTVESQTGFKRAELIEKYATAEEKASLETAKSTAEAEGKNVNSITWAAGKPIIKRILAEHPELIRK